MTAETIAAGISALTPVIAALALAYKRIKDNIGHKQRDSDPSIRDLIVSIDRKVDIVAAQQMQQGERIGRLEDAVFSDEEERSYSGLS